MERNCAGGLGSRGADGMMSILKHRRFKHFLQVFLLTLIFGFFDPFSSATNSARLSEALFYWAIAPEYPKPLKDVQTKGLFNDDTQMAVIVINDESLAAENVTWPPPFRIHEKILRKIFEESAPRALFIDFGFFDQRNTKEVQALADLLGAMAVQKANFEDCLGIIGLGEANCQWVDSDDGKIPIFLTGLGDLKGAHPDVLPELAEAVSGLVSTRYIGDDLATYNEYELFDCQAMLPSAALALYLAGSENRLSDSIRANARCVGNKLDGQAKPEFEPKLSVFWADWGTEADGRGVYPCQTLPPLARARVWSIVRDWLEGIWYSTLTILPVGNRVEAFQPAARRQTCPPAPAAGAHHFLADQSQRMTAFLNDRYVFYGGNFLMADDLIRPPTHEPVPGVFLHAMVLDNLLRGQHKFTKSIWKSLGLTILAMAIAALCSALSWAMFDARMPASTKPGTVAAAKFFRAGNAAIMSEWTVRRELLRVSGICGCQLKNACKFCWNGRKWGWSIGYVLLGLMICCVLIVFVAYGAFFRADLAPINFVGIISLIGLDAGVRGMRELLDRVF